MLYIFIRIPQTHSIVHKSVGNLWITYAVLVHPNTTTRAQSKALDLCPANQQALSSWPPDQFIIQVTDPLVKSCLINSPQAPNNDNHKTN